MGTKYLSREDEAPARGACGPRRRGPGKRSLPGQEDEAPARGACRAKETRPRQEELAGMTKPKHQGPGERSSPGRPNQGTSREARHGAPRAPGRSDEWQALRHGKTAAAASHHLRLALQLTCPRLTPGLSQRHVAGCCAV